MYYELYEQFKDELVSGEEMLWSGKPGLSILSSRGTVFMLLFGIFWLGFSLFWEFGAIVAYLESGVIIFPIFGIPFVIIGLFLVFGLPVYMRHKKKNTVYAVTSKRLIIITYKRRDKDVQTTFIKDIKGINKTVKRNGVGTIVFGNNPALAYMGVNSGMIRYGGAYGPYYGEMCPVFYDISDAEQVYKMVHDLWVKTH